MSIIFKFCLEGILTYTVPQYPCLVSQSKHLSFRITVWHHKGCLMMSMTLGTKYVMPNNDPGDSFFYDERVL